MAAQRDPIAKVLTFFDLAATAAESRNFRGCLYANAATEFPGLQLEPVRTHREWFRATVAALLREAGWHARTASPGRCSCSTTVR